MALFDGSDPKVRVTVALYREQVEELKAEAVDSDGKRVSLSRVVRAAIDFGLRDIRRRERRRQMKAEESDTSKPHRQGQYDASLVAPVTKQVHDAVLEEAESQGKDRATLLRELIDFALATVKEEQGQGPTISEGAITWDLYGYYYIRVEQERGGWALTLRKTDGGPPARIGPLPSPSDVVALGNLISSGCLLVDHDEISGGGRQYSLRFDEQQLRTV